MKKCNLVLIILGFSLTIAGNAFALIIFEDNFDDINVTGRTGLNYTQFDNWTVAEGTVDVIGEGTNWDFFPSDGYGKYVDLDGSTRYAGTMFSNDNLFELAAGDYVLSFDLAGNQRTTATDTATFGVQINSFAMQTYTRSGYDVFSTETYSFTLSQATSVDFSFGGVGGDNIGLLLDNITLSSTQPVPEPTTLLLFGAGLVGLAGFSRRKKK